MPDHSDPSTTGDHGTDAALPRVTRLAAHGVMVERVAAGLGGSA